MSAVRAGTCCVLRVVRTVNGGPEEQTTLYGPFLPHFGASANDMVDRLEREIGDELVSITSETVFIGDNESDLKVVNR